MKPSLRLRPEAIAHNVTTWRTFLQRPVWAVVKCDAYRMGAIEVARAAIEAGAQRLCVVEISEGVELREAGVSAPIVHVAATPQGDFEAAIRNDIVVSVGDADNAAVLDRAAQRMRKRVKAHVAVETGTGWWGVPYADAEAFAQAVGGLRTIEWEGVWTHIAGRDSMEEQAKRFATAVAALREHGLPIGVVHAASTGPALWGWKDGAARIGVGLYGSTLGAAREGLHLKTAFEVSAPLYAVRQFSEATPLGYGGTYLAQPGQTIATLRVGYGEGLPKTLAGRGRVQLDGVLCPVVGAIGMNFTMVAVPPEADLSRADQALVTGDVSGLRLDDVAAAAQTIPHNVLTMFGSGLR